MAHQCLREATINYYFLTRDIRGTIAGKEGDGLGNILRLSNSPERHRCGALLKDAGGLVEGLAERCSHKTGADNIRANAS